MDDEVRPLFDAADTDGVSPPKKRAGGTQVLVIQAVCCAALILLFWLFKVCGGSAYDGLRAAFTRALQDNTLLETVAGVFREREPDAQYTVENGTVLTAPSATETTVAEETLPTAAATAPTAAVTEAADG